MIAHTAIKPPPPPAHLPAEIFVANDQIELSRQSTCSAEPISVPPNPHSTAQARAPAGTARIQPPPPRHPSISNGVTARQTISFANTADSNPVTANNSANNREGRHISPQQFAA